MTALRAIEPGDSLVRLVERFGEMYSQGRYADSAAIAADILAFLQEHRSPLDLDLAANLNNLGSLAYAQGQLDMSEPFYQGALRIYQKVLGPDNINTASVLYNLAGLYLETGRSDEALPLYRHALEIRVRKLGNQHPLVAEILNNIGFIHLSQGRYVDAEENLVKALHSWKDATDGPFAAIALNNLAYLRARQGRFSEAKSLCMQALAIEERVFGKQHPEPAVTLLNLAEIHHGSGQPDLVISTVEKALRIFEQTLNADDPLAVESRRRLAELERIQ